MTKEEIIDTLTEILGEAKGFADCIKYDYNFRTINDLYNFPQYIVDKLTNVIDDMENDDENMEIEHVQEEQNCMKINDFKILIKKFANKLK